MSKAKKTKKKLIKTLAPPLNKEAEGSINPKFIPYEPFEDNDGGLVAYIIYNDPESKSIYFGVMPKITKDHPSEDRDGNEVIVPKGLYLEVIEMRMGMSMIGIRYKINDNPEYKPQVKEEPVKFFKPIL